jgi:hypothetical protein
VSGAGPLKDRTYMCTQSECPNNGRIVTIKAELIGDGNFVRFPEAPLCAGCGIEPRIVGNGLRLAVEILRKGLEFRVQVPGKHLIGVSPEALEIVLSHVTNEVGP